MKPDLLELIAEKDLPQYGAPHHSQLKRDIKAGKFPRPVRLSERRAMWVREEVALWQRNKLRERDEQTRAKKK